jgi:hypothetical protein
MEQIPLYQYVTAKNLVKYSYLLLYLSLSFLEKMHFHQCICVYIDMMTHLLLHRNIQNVLPGKGGVHLSITRVI